MTYSLPYSFVPGTKARAQEVNANFLTLLDALTQKADKDFSNLTSAATDVIKNNSSIRNIGEIVTSAIPLTDAGLHLLDGALIYGSGAYAEFVDYIANLYGDGANSPSYFTTETEWQTSVTTYGVCAKFVYDSENNTVRLPKITGFIEGTTDTNALGDLVEQFVRLPNITGHAGVWMWGGQSASGAMNLWGTTGTFKTGTSASNAGYGGWDFNASRCSSVYSGNGTNTVIQPQSVKLLVYIVVATTPKTDIQVDIDNVMTDLNSKADRDLSNISDAGKVFGGGLAMPSSRYVDLTVGSHGTQYTAPANGYFQFNISTSVTGDYLYGLVNISCNISSTTRLTKSSHVAQVYIPCKKSDIISLHSDNQTVTGSLRFIYAEGSESEAQ